MSNLEDRLKIAIIAPPWLSLYPRCYFGIENMIHSLVIGLKELGHHVEIFTVSTSKTAADKTHWYHRKEQYQHIHKPYYHTASIIISHILHALNIIKEDGDFDIIHDHNNFIGPAMLSYLDSNFPPVLHTLHQPFSDDALVRQGFPDNRLMFDQLRTVKNLFLNSVSQSQRSTAPKELESRIVDVVHNGINVDEYEFQAEKKDHFIFVGSIKKDKGVDVAARLSSKLGEQLRIMGVLAGSIDSPEKLSQELENPSERYHDDDDFKYFASQTAQYLQPGKIEFVGSVNGKEKLKLFSDAKALLFPIRWEEPFGIAVIEAMASGTPVVAFRRGAMPELIDHGVNGFLADEEDEFKKYMQRVDEIDPKVCREIVKEKFSAQSMAKNYVNAYWQVIARAQR